jgi:hypothetical protein
MDEHITLYNLKKHVSALFTNLSNLVWCPEPSVSFMSHNAEIPHPSECVCVVLRE